MARQARLETHYIPDNEEVALDRPEWATHVRMQRLGRPDMEVIFSDHAIDGHSEPIPAGNPVEYKKLVVLNEYDPVWNRLRANARWE